MNYINLNKKLLKFKNKDKYGRVIDWDGIKEKNRKMAGYFYYLGFPNAKNMWNCANNMIFKKTNLGHLKLHQTYLCKDRMCPNCNRMKYLNRARDVETIFNKAAKRHPKGKFMFFTFTEKNVNNGKSLHNSIIKMNSAISRMFKYKKISNHLLGYVRSDEIAISRDTRELSYNQHIHVVAFFKSGFFSGKNYVSKYKFRKYWKKAMKLNYEPSVDVKTINSGKTTSALSNAKSLAKYQMKPYNLIENNRLNDNEKKIKAIYDYHVGLKGTHKISYHGIFKEVKQEVDLIKKNAKHEFEHVPKNAPAYFIKYFDNRDFKGYYVTGMLIPNKKTKKSSVIKNKDVHKQFKRVK